MNGRKLLHSIEELDAIFQRDTCLIYGAGRMARVLIKYIAAKGYSVDKILVSSMAGNPRAVMGIPVCTAAECQENFMDQCLIVAAMEASQDELENETAPLPFRRRYFVSDELFGKLTYQMGSYETDCLNRLEDLGGEMAALEKRLLRFIPRPCLEYLVVNILDHCNLKCKGCDHFACVADPYFVAYETIRKDLERLSELFDGDFIMKIAVMGGEPLLHPDLSRILQAVRTYFPHTIIRLSTNGLLLLKQGEEFWKICRENDVTIVNTKYPIKLDFHAMQEKAEREGVKFQFFEGTGDHIVKKSFKKRIHLKGDRNPVESFANCHISNYGNFLMEGKLYGCPFACQSYRIFNKKFNQNLRMTDKDFLDIYKIQNVQEIFEFAARPKYYCRYCSGLSPLFDWTISRQEIGEWIDEEDIR